jgi:hypothetical protein
MPNIYEGRVFGLVLGDPCAEEPSAALYDAVAKATHTLPPDGATTRSQEGWLFEIVPLSGLEEVRMKRLVTYINVAPEGRCGA